MTVAQKIQALKGATIGAVTVGGAPAQVVRYLLRQNNLKPDADVRFAAVGAGSARVNALKNGQVDMIGRKPNAALLDEQLDDALKRDDAPANRQTPPALCLLENTQRAPVFGLGCHSLTPSVWSPSRSSLIPP
jgi:ABC-type nitrate/sulfonate/bicarbonate transport system substrate-binding protein